MLRRGACSSTRAPETVGEIDDWPDGIQAIEGQLFKQVPFGDFDSQTWVTKDGRVKMRIFDPISDAWFWSPMERQLHVNELGGTSVDIGCNGQRRRMQLARVIAMAHINCPEDLCKPHACLLDQSSAVHAENIGWRQAGATNELICAHVRACEEPDGPEDDEEKRALCYEWVAKNGDRLQRTTDEPTNNYLLTKSGWVFSKICMKWTRGIRHPDGNYYVALAELGLACVKDAVDTTFHKTQQLPRYVLTKTETLTGFALAQKWTVDEWMREHKIKLPVLWQRIAAYVQHALFEEAQNVWRVLPSQLRNLPCDDTKSMKERLSELRKSGSTLAAVEDCTAFGMIIAARTLIRRKILRARFAQTYS